MSASMVTRGQDFAKELRRVRSEDQERILTELESRVCEQVLALRGTPGVQEVLEESLYRERRRLKDDGGHSPAYEGDQAFWEQIQRSIRHASDRDLRMLLRRSIRHYGEEIAGNFDPRVYKVATRILPSGLSVLMNAMSPKRLFTRLPEFPSIEDSIMIGGATEEARRLHEQGTVILVPTHVSNLDSIVVGYALYQLGLPPFIYGAGLNLFTNPLLSFFMHNLGAYTVDRKKTDPLYKEVLKHYATLTLEFGYDNIFFPGGTRSRSGAIERRLKYGLLGTGVQAYINNLQRKRERPKLFIVPMTLSFDLVLEAETLIDDFLKEVGKARYI
ncbi:MAG: 1-acyl-sn-glycerol-3-phosphate acyltransferase, partial [Myxococcota bacterium]